MILSLQRIKNLVVLWPASSISSFKILRLYISAASGDAIAAIEISFKSETSLADPAVSALTTGF